LQRVISIDGGNARATIILVEAGASTFRWYLGNAASHQSSSSVE
jgi:hypothetical protein